MTFRMTFRMTLRMTFNSWDFMGVYREDFTGDLEGYFKYSETLLVSRLGQVLPRSDPVLIL